LDRHHSVRLVVNDNALDAYALSMFMHPYTIVFIVIAILLVMAIANILSMLRGPEKGQPPDNNDGIAGKQI
jgi:hypothetical protein